MGLLSTLHALIGGVLLVCAGLVVLASGLYAIVVLVELFIHLLTEYGKNSLKRIKNGYANSSRH